MCEFEFLTPKEFAAKLKVQRDQVYKWIEIGRIKAIRVNNYENSHWRIPYAELKRLHAQAYDTNYGMEVEND